MAAGVGQILRMAAVSTRAGASRGEGKETARTCRCWPEVSFRHRLALFFVLVVVVPMLAVAFMLFRLIGQSERGKSDAAIAAQHHVAQRLFAVQDARARRAIRDVVAGDRVLRSSIADGQVGRAAKRARQLVKFAASSASCSCATGGRFCRRATTQRSHQRSGVSSRRPGAASGAWRSASSTPRHTRVASAGSRVCTRSCATGVRRWRARCRSPRCVNCLPSSR